jgi:4-amino-4-deoxy-L-arabinose transferase-like glycosyltransferase
VTARRIAPASLALALALTVTVVGWRSVTPERERGGSLHNLSMAYNLWKYGTVSSSRTDDPAYTTPDWRREPLYPALLAFSLALTSDADEVTLGCLSGDGDVCADSRIALKRTNAVLLGLLAAATFLVAELVLRNSWQALLAAFLVATSGAHWQILDRMKSEPLATLLLLLACAGLHGASHPGRRLAWAGLGGVALGLLILTKAVFFYAGPVLLVCALLAARRPGDRSGRAVLVALAIAYAVAGVWVGRNIHHGAGFKIADDRDVLSIRAEHDTMGAREYAAAWLFFPGERNPAARRLLEAIFEPADWARLDDQNPAGFYLSAKKRTGAVAARTGVERPGAAQMSTAARSVVLENAPMHVALTGPFAVRSLFVAWPLYDFQILWWAMYTIVNLFIPAIFALAWIRVRQKRFDELWFLALPLFSFAIHAFASHAIVRYSWPLIPPGAIAWVGLAAMLAAGKIRKDPDEPAILPR